MCLAAKHKHTQKQNAEIRTINALEYAAAFPLVRHRAQLQQLIAACNIKVEVKKIPKGN
jgi:hypothetical protein